MEETTRFAVSGENNQTQLLCLIRSTKQHTVGDSVSIMMDRLSSSTNHGKQWPSLNGKWIVLVLLVVQEIDLVVTGHCGHPHRHVVVVVVFVVVVIGPHSGCARPGPTGRQTKRQTIDERIGESCQTVFPTLRLSSCPSFRLDSVSNQSDPQ